MSDLNDPFEPGRILIDYCRAHFCYSPPLIEAPFGEAEWDAAEQEDAKQIARKEALLDRLWHLYAPFRRAARQAGLTNAYVDTRWDKLEKAIDTIRRDYFCYHSGPVFARAKLMVHAFDTCHAAVDVLERTARIIADWAATQERKAAPLHPRQEMILEALDGKALQTKDLEKLLDISRGQLFRDYLNPLKDLGLVKHKSGVGYFRPDRPPRHQRATRT